MTGIPQVLGQGVAGYLTSREIQAFCQILNDPPRPLVAIVGGSKVSDKILLLENMIEKIDRLVIGGAMSYTFLKAQGYEIGKSFSQAGQTFIDKKSGNEIEIIELARKLLEKAKEKGVQVSLPLDHICHTSFGEPGDQQQALITPDANIPADYMALDIGPKTVELYTSIVRDCQSAIWNGPLGVFELTTYCQGTFSIARAMGEETDSSKGMLTIIGGGDSASAVELSGYAKHMSHVSTGGGASLELLEGKELPGIAVLDDA
jgi:phosphoglycerate kinase